MTPLFICQVNALAYGQHTHHSKCSLYKENRPDSFESVLILSRINYSFEITIPYGGNEFAVAFQARTVVPGLIVTVDVPQFTYIL